MNLDRQPTNFENVSQLNELWGNKKGDPTDPSWKKIKNQAKNIQDEYNELLEALDTENMTELRDAICDILVFTYGLAHIAGVPCDVDMDAVDRSNRSKFCKDINVMTDTILYYQDRGVEVVGEGTYPLAYVRSKKHQIGLDNKEYQADKILKAVGWSEPVFHELNGVV